MEDSKGMTRLGEAFWVGHSSMIGVFGDGCPLFVFDNARNLIMLGPSACEV